jgi:hypothetical protein
VRLDLSIKRKIRIKFKVYNDSWDHIKTKHELYKKESNGVRFKTSILSPGDY